MPLYDCIMMLIVCKNVSKGWSHIRAKGTKSNNVFGVGVSREEELNLMNIFRYGRQ